MALSSAVKVAHPAETNGVSSRFAAISTFLTLRATWRPLFSLATRFACRFPMSATRAGCYRPTLVTAKSVLRVRLAPHSGSISSRTRNDLASNPQLARARDRLGRLLELFPGRATAPERAFFRAPGRPPFGRGPPDRGGLPLLIGSALMRLSTS